MPVPGGAAGCNDEHSKVRGGAENGNPSKRPDQPQPGRFPYDTCIKVGYRLDAEAHPCRFTELRERKFESISLHGRVRLSPAFASEVESPAFRAARGWLGAEAAQCLGRRGRPFTKSSPRCPRIHMPVTIRDSSEPGRPPCWRCPRARSAPADAPPRASSPANCPLQPPRHRRRSLSRTVRSRDTQLSGARIQPHRTGDRGDARLRRGVAITAATPSAPRWMPC